ncbi:dihydrofolate reductase family protein [Dyadobacter fanqingshengii]|uniref:Dihydrofolate reductase family protein n=1 Tax=Dyadobacter fanqingshengii TaxID=2906443 RepID=A0A9X1PAQ0_9BACT|nr:dihydrofolate reductase family protein [Dyadobacter fanqingshengii]MCF0040769.1 dihydrofolate reductase family protein [Dyadobacter fanqingshengii]USJ37495.1 dihydrofolate reductase family protein [Dyadobacter fanqingshengii]
MRKLVLFAHMSLDGFAGDINGGLGFLTYNEELQQFADELVKTVGAPVYGKNTYHLMEGYWPTVLNDPNANGHALAHAKWVQEIPKIVFSTTLESADWNNTTLIKDNIEEEVNNLKQQSGKDLVIFGSPGLAKSLMNLGLIDEYQITLHPVIMGAGISLFEGNTQMSNLKLLESKTLGSGVVTLHYTNR